MIYMDNAATSWPKPRVVASAVSLCLEKYGANPGRSGHRMAVQAGSILLYTREMLCQLLNGSDPFQFIFTSNCAESLNLAIKGLLKPDDHVITSSMEHNSLIRPLTTLEKALNVHVTIVPCDPLGRLDPQDVERAVRSTTRLIATTHASNVTGTLMPVEAIGRIARGHGIPYLVDAAQTIGVLPIDLKALPVDLLAFPGHKGLFGPQGTGGLYIAPHITLRPLKEGGTGSQSESLHQPEFLPDAYESGTLNTPGIAGLGAGIHYILKKGLRTLRNQESRLEHLLMEALCDMKGITIYGPTDPKERVGAISVNIGDMDSSEAANRLDAQFSIATRGALHCAPLAHQTLGTLRQGTVRFSPGIFNTLEEVKDCLRALKRLMGP
jgi:cysteine desulfurase family protein